MLIYKTQYLKFMYRLKNVSHYQSKKLVSWKDPFRQKAKKTHNHLCVAIKLKLCGQRSPLKIHIFPYNSSLLKKEFVDLNTHRVIQRTFPLLVTLLVSLKRIQLKPETMFLKSISVCFSHLGSSR